MFIKLLVSNAITQGGTLFCPGVYRIMCIMDVELFYYIQYNSTN